MAFSVSTVIWNLKSRYYRWLRRFFVTKRIYQAEIRPFRRWLENQFSPNGRYLDLAAGSGDSLSLYPPHAQVVALDLSLAMLHLLKSKFSVPVLQARGERLPFQPAVFSGITAIGLIEYVPLLEMLFAELHRILLPHGWLAVTFSQPNVLNILRNFTGNRVRFYTRRRLAQVANHQGFEIVGWNKTLFQTQVFLRKLPKKDQTSANHETF